MPIVRRLGARGHHVDTRFKAGDRITNRECRRDIVVQPLFDFASAFPNRNAKIFPDLALLISIQCVVQQVALRNRSKVTNTNPMNPQGDFLKVHGDNRNRRRGGFWQNVRTASEPHRWIAIAHVDIQRRRSVQLFVTGRGEALANREFVAIAVLDSIDAKLVAFRFNRKFAVICADIRGVLDGTA